MHNVIFGSGVTGLLAKLLLGDDWQVVPFYKSRFFCFTPPLDDNYIIRDVKLDPIINDIMGNKVSIFNYRRAFSYEGELIRDYTISLYDSWLIKLFGFNVPPHVKHYLNDKLNFEVYDVRINELYQSLFQRYAEQLVAEAAKGLVTEIGDHYFIRNGIRTDFDNAISTIPLNALTKLMKIGYEFFTKPCFYYHVLSETLNFEGNNQVLVVDPKFGFFKVTNIAPNRYMIYCNEDLVNPGIYLMPIIKNFEILDGTSINDAIIVGPMPKLDAIINCGINCVGSYAQWDWCMDVGSSILRLVNLSRDGFKPKQLVKV